LRGVFRPNLSKVASNEDHLVEKTTADAFSQAKAGEEEKAFKTLSKGLHGVGPATASILLSLVRPDAIAFLSDEAQASLGLLPYKYTIPQCLKLNAMLRDRALHLEHEGQTKWSVVDLERCLYTDRTSK